MGAQLTREGKAEVEDHEVHLFEDDLDRRRLNLNVPEAVIELFEDNKQAVLALDLLREVLAEAVRCQPDHRARGRRGDAQTCEKGLTRDQAQALQLAKTAFMLDQAELKFLSTACSWLGNKPNKVEVSRNRRDSSPVEKHQDLGETSPVSPSNQIKKVNFQTYEYLSRDIIREKSFEDNSYDSGSLGEDTEENVKNMNLDWNLSRRGQQNQNIGATLKNLVTQNSMVSAINIGSTSGKHLVRKVHQDEPPMGKENKLPGEGSAAKRSNEEKFLQMKQMSTNSTEGYKPKSYAGIYNAKRETAAPRGFGDAEHMELREKDVARQVELRNIRGIPNMHTRPVYELADKAAYNFTSFTPNGQSSNQGPKVEKRLLFNDQE
jgi:hypothetical protein